MLEVDPASGLVFVMNQLQEVVGTARTVEPGLVAVEHRQQLEADPRDGPDRHQRTVEPTLQPSGWKREQQIDQSDDPRRLDGQSDRVQPGCRGLCQLRGEPGKAGKHHDLAEPVVRPGLPGGEAAAQ